MKTKQEQIDEMAQYMCNIDDENYNCRNCVVNSPCIYLQCARKTYNQGYRKATEVIDEFVERLKEENEISFRRYGKGIGISTIFRVADEMRQGVEK